MVIKKEILYPIFLECLKYINDGFWENIFEDLAYGRTPYGTYITKDILCCNYKDKEFQYKIEKKNPEALYNEIYYLLHKKLGVLSLRDKANKQLDFQMIENELKECRKSWSNIRKKNIKDLLIEKFVLDMKLKHSLTYIQAQKLLSNIFIGLIFKVISVKDIEYVGGKIISINGIIFSENEFNFEKNIYDNNIEFRKCILIEKNEMSENWEKYISNLRKLAQY
jgi:hypothetical protein